MFIGHYGAGLAAKKLAPQVSLGTLILAVQFIDLLWPIFLLLGFEHVRIDPGNTVVTPLDFYDYPITHSLVGALGWSAALGLVYFAVRRSARSACVVGAGVLSHWFLDALVHRPDLLLIPGGSTRVGLGAWNSLPLTVVFEVGTFSIGAALYLSATKARDRVGNWALWSMLGLLTLIWGSTLVSPPPPSVRAVMLAGLGAGLFVPWGYWIDRHREAAPRT